MSYFEKRESKSKYKYQIEPTESFGVIHNCAGCGRKERFINTGRFRVNANGNRLDVWLIYQCEKCKHTLNLSIYERVDRKKIPTEDYQLFLKNDEVLAERFGMDSAFFKKNRVEVDWDKVSLSVKAIQNNKLVVGEQEQSEAHVGTTVCAGKLIDTEENVVGEVLDCVSGDMIIIHNPHGIHIRPEKLAGMILNMSRSTVKRMLDRKEIILSQKGFDIEITVC